MKVTAFTAAIALTAVGFGTPAAQDDRNTETIAGLVRIAGAQAGIDRYCRMFYTIDDAVFQGLVRTARGALDKGLGRRQAQTAIDREAERAAMEIEDLGARQWCAEKHDSLNTDGVRVFID